MQSDYSYSCVAKAMAYRLIIASVVAIAAACPYSQIQQYLHLNETRNGTDCSVFHYTKRCCLPGSVCTVQNGNKKCHCSPDCYRSDKVECCEDVHCPNGNDTVANLIIIMNVCPYIELI